MVFCSVVIVSPNAPSGALRHPDRSAPCLGSRFAEGIGHLCQIKFWLMQPRVKCVRVTAIAPNPLQPWAHSDLHVNVNLQGDPCN